MVVGVGATGAQGLVLPALPLNPRFGVALPLELPADVFLAIVFSHPSGSAYLHDGRSEYLLQTFALILAFSSGEACCEARANALAPWLLSGIGYRPPGRAKSFLLSLSRSSCVSLATLPALLRERGSRVLHRRSLLARSLAAFLTAFSTCHDVLPLLVSRKLFQRILVTAL